MSLEIGRERRSIYKVGIDMVTRLRDSFICILSLIYGLKPINIATTYETCVDNNFNMIQDIREYIIHTHIHSMIIFELNQYSRFLFLNFSSTQR